MHWNCPNCGESIDPALDICWQCGTMRDGSIDPNFAHADDYQPPIIEERPQFHLRTMLKLMAAGCLVYAMCGGLTRGTWNALSVLLGVAGLMFVSLYAFSWLLLNRVRKWQREVRQSVRTSGVDRKSIDD